MKTYLSLDRWVRPWHFTISHKTLILRSTKDDQHATQVDVLFKPAYAMCLQSQYSPFVVREPTAEEAESIREISGLEQTEDRNFYVLEGGSGFSFVVASVTAFDENTGGYFDDPKWLTLPE